MADTTTYRINAIEEWIETQPGRRINTQTIAKEFGIDTCSASNYLCRIKPRNPHFKKVAPGVIMYDPDDTTEEWKNDIDIIHDVLKAVKKGTTEDLRKLSGLDDRTFDNAMSMLRLRKKVHIKREVVWTLITEDEPQTKMYMGMNNER